MAATLRVRFTTDDASDASPSWTDVTDQVRSFTLTQGSDNEFSKVDAATCTIVVDNRVQQFDPTDDPTIRPMNRWEITETITGEVQFIGYARSYTQQWPAPGVDAVTVVECVDEFMVLALDRLPQMDPPTAQSYADVVRSDEPQGYWQFNTETTSGNALLMSPTVGSQLMGTYGGGTFSTVSSPIAGDYDTISANTARSITTYIATADSNTYLAGIEQKGPGDAEGLSAWTVEFWFKSSEATPAAQREIMIGPESGAASQYGLQLTTGGLWRGFARNSTGGLFIALGTNPISADTWYHFALVVTGSATNVYVNGVLEATASYSGVAGAKDANAFLRLGTLTAVGGTRHYDEPAFYRYAVPLARLQAHYTAGVSRGYVSDAPSDRADAVMADSTSIAAFDFSSTIGREIIPTFQYGQSPLDELRRCEDAEQGFLFVAKDGTVTMLQAGYQGISPYNVVQATFDDDGTDLKYRQVDVDYSSTFLFNQVTTAREGGETFVESDAASITEYLRRPLSIPALPVVDDGDVAALAAELLAKYKDPVHRITSLTVDTSDQDVANAVLPLDLGALVEVNVTQPNAGRIQQQLHVRKRIVSGTPGTPWIITLGLSPY